MEPRRAWRRAVPGKRLADELSSDDLNSRSSETMAELTHLPAEDTPSARTRLRSELLPVLVEIQKVREEAAAEADWYWKACESAKARLVLLDRHLAALTTLLSVGQTAEPLNTHPASVSVSHAIAREAAPLAIFCMGRFRVRRNGEWIDEWPSLRGQAILKYLAAHARTGVSRDVLMDTFWPEADAESARRNLHQAIYSLRQAIRLDDSAQPILLVNGHYQLNPHLAMWIDAEEYEKRLLAGRRLQEEGLLEEAALEYSFALGLYQGDFLEQDEYADWVAKHREAKRRSYREAAAFLSGYFYDRGDYAVAIAICKRLIELDGCDEQAHAKLILCYSRQGDRATAIRQYHVCKHALRDELGVSPSAETQALLTSILRDEGQAETVGQSQANVSDGNRNSPRPWSERLQLHRSVAAIALIVFAGGRPFA